MSMTEKDRKRFDEIMSKFRDWQAEHHDLSENQWKQRIENLEKLVFFMALNEAGEIGITAELRELLKKCGFYELFEKALSP